MGEEVAFRILHFNDVYEITPGTREPCGGATRFRTLQKQLEEKYGSLLVLFSGDGFSPSVMSSVTGGEHMIPVLNEIGIHSATLGNHDFDFGMESCQALMGETSCAPWMLANIVDEEGKPIVGG